MPETPIMDMVNNIEPFYLDKEALLGRWARLYDLPLDLYDKMKVEKEAKELAAHFAEAIESSEDWREGKYTKKEIDEAVQEMIEEFTEEV